MQDDKFPVETCPICGEGFKKTRSWQEGCGKVSCRRKKSQIKQFSEIVRDSAERQIEEFTAKIKAGWRF